MNTQVQSNVIFSISKIKLTETEQLKQIGEFMNPSDKISLQHHEQVRFVKKREISRLSGLSGVTLNKYRLSGTLSEDIHWVRVNVFTGFELMQNLFFLFLIGFIILMIRLLINEVSNLI
ncbi:hypothetical protein [Thermocoleostomius sinensis]|uniref:Uncharacterized protein n=1 Tax=Thermocoleostomius sinensis A174 TaxID=2016057 RepID=A0A9E8ZGR8_9CYAN|nr:hypothetical protein [Thermocoleostomius sinensis]WAL62466.1 hypothetical protein OXH18_10875 [Thermocoleostomius sinensis A174]